MAVATRTRALVPQLLRENREFRVFFSAQAVSYVGDQISLLAIPLVAVLALDANAAEMGYLTAALLLPNLLSLHAGAWVDRRGRRRQLMLLTDLGRGALLVTIPVAYALGVLTMGQLYVVGLAIGALTVLFMVSHSTLFVSLVGREDYVEANSLLNGSRAFSFVGGPPLAGLLVQVASAPAALVVDAVTYLFSALCLARIDPEEPPTETAESGHVTAGARYIRRSPTVRSLLASAAWINFFNFIFWAIFVLYATKSLGVSPGLLGVVLGAAAVGGILGATFAGRIGRRIGIGPTLALGCVVFTAPLICVPLAGGSQIVILALLFVSEFGSGFGVMLLDIAAGSIKAALVPDRLRARVSGAFMVINYGVRPAGALVGGLLGTWIGLHATMWIATVGAVFGVLFLLPSPILRMHDLPGEAEELD